MHSFWTFFLRKRQFTWLVIVALTLIGLFAAYIIPKESSPEVEVPIGTVVTTYPGAPAADIEELITNKIEDKVGNLDNIKKTSSASQDGVSMITVEFDASADIDKSIQDLKDAVDAAKGTLPRDANDPIVTKVSFSNQPIVIIAISADLPPVEFTALGTRIQDELQGVAGASDVTISGTRKRETQIVVKQEALSTYNLTLDQVSAALQAANLTMPVGTVVTNDIEYAIRFEGDIASAEEIGNIPVKNQNGQTIFVRDVAQVINGVERESTVSRVSVDGKPAESAMTVAVYKRAGSDVTALSKGVNEKIESLKAPGGLLADSQVLIVFDQGKNVKKDLLDLTETGMETVILVVICLLLTIGWRESLVAALSIPLSFVIAFIGLYLSGNTINFVSLFALILAVGILVDSGIVVTEAIHTRMRRLANPDEAATQAIREYSWPLIGGTMTTVAVFVPLFFLSGITGEFIASIPYTIIFVLIASIFVALGMVPLIAIKLTKSTSSNKFEALQEEYSHKAQTWYRSHLRSFLQNIRAQRIFLWVLAISFFAVLALPVSGIMKVVFFPGEDVDNVYIDVEAKQGTPVTETDLSLRAAEEILYDLPYVESFTSTAGAGSMFTGGGGSAGKYGNITITLREDRDITSAEASTEIRKALQPIKTAEFKITEQQSGPPSGAPVFIKFFGNNLDDLARSAERADKLLASIPGTRDVETSTKNNATEIVLTINKAKASALGVSPGAVGSVLRGAVYGVTATTITENGDDVDIIAKIELNPNSDDPSETPRVTLNDLKSLPLATQDGSTVLLGSVVDETLSAAHASIAHEDEERLETVSAYVNPGTTATEVVSAFKEREAELQMANGVRISYGGETEDINRSFTEMFVALIAGLVFMLAILVLSFNSIRYALYLLLAVPYALIGVFIGLTITAQPLSFTSLLGVIALAGVIINHAIILMDSLIHMRNARSAEPLLEVVSDAAVTRLRPIILTTITTVIGMIPLSTISDFWSPLAFTIMFGLTFAMILTLVLVPTLFYRHQAKLERKAKEAALAASPDPRTP